MTSSLLCQGVAGHPLAGGEGDAGGAGEVSTADSLTIHSVGFISSVCVCVCLFPTAIISVTMSTWFDPEKTGRSLLSCAIR